MPAATISEGGVDAAGDPPASADGRRARRERNRAAVVDALLELFRAGDLAPSSEQIAARAGLSPRSVFRYFDDIDDLCRAAIERQREQVWPIVITDVDHGLALEQRIAALVAQRADVFDAMGSVGQVARLRAPFQPLVAAQLDESRRFLRRQIERVLDRELGALDAEWARRMAAAIDVICSYEAYQLLRGAHGLTRDQACDVLRAAVGRLLAPERPR